MAIAFKLWLIFLFATSTLADKKAGRSYAVSLKKLRVTQVVAGMEEIAIRTQQIVNARDEDRLKKIKKDKVGTAVLGPEGEIFLIDGHHFARALLEAGEKEMDIRIKDDFSELSRARFWQRMIQEKYVYLLDEKGRPIKIDEIEGASLKSLRDDPYRSLVWLLKLGEAYDQTNKHPFLEFAWANHLRRLVKLKVTKDGAVDWKMAVKDSLPHVAKAMQLPGWVAEGADKCKWSMIRSEVQRRYGADRYGTI